jgi:hypothetical protein
MFNYFGHIPDGDDKEREAAHREYENMRREDERRWQKIREQEHESMRENEKLRQASHSDFNIRIIFAIISMPFWIVIKIFRYGHGRHFLMMLFLLFFVGPAGVLIVALMLRIHAEPSVFLAHWHAYVARHPTAASWTWAIRDITQALTAG